LAGASEQTAPAARPHRELRLDDRRIRLALEREEGQRGLGGRALARRRYRGFGGAADGVRKVGPDDRVVHDRRPPRRRLREPVGRPGGQICALHDRGRLTGDRDRALQEVEAVALVRKDAGEQGEPAVFGRRVDRVQVTAGALRYLEPGGEGRPHAGQEVGEPHRRVLRAERGAVLLVLEAVEAQVEAGARAQLEQP
jgi:hypothetical protein